MENIYEEMKSFIKGREFLESLNGNAGNKKHTIRDEEFLK